MDTIRVKPTILQRPYSERQKIVITEDSMADAMREIEDTVSRGLTEPSPTDIALRILFPTGFIVKSTVEVVAKEISQWACAKDDGLSILHVGRSEIFELVFAPGHPRKNVLYVGHPAIPRMYYTVADFHRVTFEHKVLEAIDLLMSLGATYIRIEHVCGWSREFSGEFSALLDRESAHIGANVREDKYSDSRLMYEATLVGKEKPQLPETLVWYPHEPTWQAVAKGRLEFALKEFTLHVNYEDDFGVNAGLRTSALKAKFDLGGKFTEYERTIWRVVGRFRIPSNVPLS